jgi:hypothetical protein
LASRLDALREAGIEAPTMAFLRAPICLNLGGKTPFEVALAPVAEMVRVRHRRAAAIRAQDPISAIRDPADREDAIPGDRVSYAPEEWQQVEQTRTVGECRT